MLIFKRAYFQKWLMLIPMIVFSHATGLTAPSIDENKQKNSASTNVSNDRNDAEKKLETIRQTLVSKALRTQARVKASAWLDGSGALHENTRITSDVITKGSPTQNSESNPFIINEIKPTSAKGVCSFF
jgi:hypothetical protein